VLQTDWRSADLNGNGVIEVSELYRALRFDCDKPDPGPANNRARQAGPHRRFSRLFQTLRWRWQPEHTRHADHRLDS
jgi:hypothetical protein